MDVIGAAPKNTTLSILNSVTIRYGGGKGVWSSSDDQRGQMFSRAVVTRGEGGFGRAVVTRGEGGLVEQW